ncbi:MAG: tail fiber protein [Rhizomicrobium sp.]|jgi:microcystin-dependent protein
MADPFIGEIRAFGFAFAPYQWASCDGQLLSINQNAALFSVLGTYFGGNGQTNFGLPNLQGNVPMHWGNGPGLSSYTIGEVEGATTITLTQGQLPMHVHTIATAEPPKNQGTPTPASTNYLGASVPDHYYSDSTAAPGTMFSSKAITIAGQSQPHNNMQPYQVLNFCIALYGLYPSRN